MEMRGYIRPVEDGNGNGESDDSESDKGGQDRVVADEGKTRATRRTVPGFHYIMC